MAELRSWFTGELARRPMARVRYWT